MKCHWLSFYFVIYPLQDATNVKSYCTHGLNKNGGHKVSSE